MGRAAWVAVGVSAYTAVVSAVLLVFRAAKRADAAMEDAAERRFAESRPDPDTEDPKGLRCTGVTSPRARAG